MEGVIDYGTIGMVPKELWWKEMIASMTDERHRQICGSDALVKMTKPTNVKTREEKGGRGVQEKREREVKRPRTKCASTSERREG